MINHKLFYSGVRKEFGKLKQSQVNGFNAILNLWELEKYTDLRHLAYMFATTWHETDCKMEPIEEYGKGKKHKYGKVDKTTGFAYYGRGFVQLTWAENYIKMGKILGFELYRSPNLALNLAIATEILFEGMLTRKSFRGDFTGKSLENYFNKKTNDPIGARKIINGTDRAKLIAGYHYKFLRALELSAEQSVQQRIAA